MPKDIQLYLDILTRLWLFGFLRRLTSKELLHQRNPAGVVFDIYGCKPRMTYNKYSFCDPPLFISERAEF